MFSITYRTFFSIFTFSSLVIDLTLSDLSKIDFDHPSSDKDTFRQYYFSERHRFDQWTLEPRDYFLSVYNPFWNRIPRQYVDYETYVNDFNLIESDYHKNVKSLSVHTTVLTGNLIDFDMKLLVPLNPNHFFRTKPIFIDLNIRYMEVLAKKRSVQLIKGNDAITAEDLQYETVIRNARNKIYDSQNYTLVEPDFIEVPTTSPRIEIKPINFETFSIIQTLMEILPGPDDTTNVYKVKHSELVKFLIEINPAAKEKLKDSNGLYEIKPISDDRVNVLKSPTVLKDEPYFYYMLRMRRLGFIAFYYQFGKDKFEGFGNSLEYEIIEAPINNVQGVMA